MKNSKFIVLGGILAVFSVLFQIMPVLFSELFAFVTIFSALPIYIISRKNPTAGLSSFITAGLLTFLISPHEGIFFIMTNGIIGLCLGLCKYNSISAIITVLINSFIITMTLNILIIFLGINVFGVGIPFSFWLQSALIIVFSIIYSFLYMRFAEFVYGRVSYL